LMTAEGLSARRKKRKVGWEGRNSERQTECKKEEKKTGEEERKKVRKKREGR
jgi:hypothetical protein